MARRNYYYTCPQSAYAEVLATIEKLVKSHDR
jgi:hypothetical protein